MSSTSTTRAKSYATTSLTLSGCKEVADLSPLSELTKLKELDLSRTSVKDLAPLKALINLRSIDLSKTPVKELDILAIRAALPMLEVKKGDNSWGGAVVAPGDVEGASSSGTKAP